MFPLPPTECFPREGNPGAQPAGPEPPPSVRCMASHCQSHGLMSPAGQRRLEDVDEVVVG